MVIIYCHFLFIKVYEVDVPKADYTEIRRTLPVRDSAAHATLLDPRLRRLIDPNDELLPPSTSSPTINQIFAIPLQTQNDEGTTSDAFVVSTQLATIVDTSKRNPSDALRPTATRSDPRSDPRRKHQTDMSTSHLAPPPSMVAHNSLAMNMPSAHQLDTQAIHSSEWYKDLSSKLKIMVNQQMAIVAAELRKFHNDSSANKVFDLTFVKQNQLLQQVLTQLGTYIDENGHFVKVDDGPSNGGGQNGRLFDDFGAPPMNQRDFVRPPPSMQQQQQHGNFHLDGAGGGSVPSFGMRPGLLGLAPPMRSGGNEFNGPYENANNGGIGNNNNNGGGGHINPFNQGYAGRPPVPTSQQQQQHQQSHHQSGSSQFSHGGSNHRWGGNQNRNANNNRQGFENTSHQQRD